MKKLIIISTLAISFIATAQLSKSNHLNFKDTLISSLYIDSMIESLPSTVVEEDAPFDFNTKDYLPVGFNPNAKKQTLDIVESSVEEDAAFDFDTKDYLPVGFNPNAKKQTLDIIESSVEEDAAFDFDTKKYLPKGFNPYKGLMKTTKSVI